VPEKSDKKVTVPVAPVLGAARASFAWRPYTGSARKPLTSSTKANGGRSATGADRTIDTKAMRASEQAGKLRSGLKEKSKAEAKGKRAQKMAARRGMAH